MVDLIKKIIKEIQKLEQQKQLKIEKRNQLDKEINIMNLRLKDLNNLKNQYEKLEKNTDSFFENIKNGDEISSFQNFQCKPACQSRRNPLPSVFRQNINSYLPHGITIRGTPRQSHQLSFMPARRSKK